MDFVLAVAGFGVGMVVGLTGMGGGALMTPILVLFFGVPPLAAVSSDLVASAVMKPFGGLVHALRGTVNWRLVAWLCTGSVPTAFAGVLVMRAVGDSGAVQHRIQLALGGALLLAVAGLLTKAYLGTRRGARTGANAKATEITAIRVRPLPTALLGALGGLVVGMTSVGSGSLIIVILLLLYPALRANDLVGTDLVQAVPLVAAGALGHIFFGDLHLDLAGTLVAGSIPGVLLGARLSARAPARLVRAALTVVLLVSGVKLLGAPNPALVVVAVVAVVAAVLLTRSARGTATPSTARHDASDGEPGTTRLAEPPVALRRHPAG